ncbi:hypothetical protein wVul_1835 [Wolbachia endosymbiont of Armadillidium vulgare str. wVulC]|uniref:hypothetical protein n=1 Tax=Wolbachia endosymbiont of Armadillidium vulgare TaxID=77039 RepID=UPI0006D4C464|nr:hypothetical protein [Wolbachia endosymbiont of Armadillidium vulgare]KLT22090.1 hypothetical protein wVul_1835 [Wolbachia endosymbiont of Armadillidium vulgare str. wVulC]
MESRKKVVILASHAQLEDVMPVSRHWHPVKFASIKVMLKDNVSDDPVPEH